MMTVYHMPYSHVRVYGSKAISKKSSFFFNEGESEVFSKQVKIFWEEILELMNDELLSWIQNETG